MLNRYLEGVHMRELTITELGVVSGGMNFDEAAFGTVMIAAGYTIAAITPAGAVVVGVGVVTAFAGGFLVGDGLVNNGKYSELLDESFEVDAQ